MSGHVPVLDLLATHPGDLGIAKVAMSAPVGTPFTPRLDKE